MNGERRSYASEFRERAREALSGKWGIAVLVAFVASILTEAGSSASNANNTAKKLSEINNPIVDQIVAVLLVFGGIAIILGIVAFFMGGAITLGYKTFLLHIVRGEEESFGDLFSRFNIFWKGFVLQLLTGIFVFLWMLLLIIPGIIATFSYAMAPFIMADNPEMDALEALRASKELMKGNRWRLFCLGFSFIGWAILCVFTCGIGFLFLKPYTDVSTAEFYQELIENQQAAQSMDQSFGEDVPTKELY